MKLLRIFQPRIGVAPLLCSLPLFAQNPKPRLGSAIASESPVPLAHSRLSPARAADDLGTLPPETPIPGITLVFRRSSAQEAALKGLLAAQLDPRSPLYHRWLTPDDFAARFGIADQDIRTTEQWLSARGFRIDRVARSRDRITFSGTAAQVRSAFGSELHRYRSAGETHFAPASDLTLPASLASITAAVLHLSDFRPKPQWKVLARPHPDFSSVPDQAHYLSPDDILTMYDAVPDADNDLTGWGQNIAIVGQSFVNTSANSSIGWFQTYLTQYTSITPVLVPGSGPDAISYGDEGESEIDLEYASGMARNSSLFFVYVGANQNYSVLDSLAYAISEDIAQIISISYGECEPLLNQTEIDQYESLFEEASAQGQTLIASSGDSGSTSCAVYSTAQGVSLTEQQSLAVSYPASSPSFTAVGGTQMAPGTFAPGSNQYWETSDASPNAGTLLSYVPEVTWNEDSSSNMRAAGGGGSSILFSRPAWQSSLANMPSGNHRLVPDIALQSSVANPGFVLCTDDPSLLYPQGQTSSCNQAVYGSNNDITSAGGTSFAAPIFAGMVALLNQTQNAASGQGNLNPVLYKLASHPDTYSAAFHDILTGSNACVSGPAACAGAAISSYQAATGYDQATGLGSIDFKALLAAWPSTTSPNLQPTLISFDFASPQVNPGDTNSIRIEISPYPQTDSSTVPTGNLSISLDGVITNPSLPVAAASPGNLIATASYTFTNPSTPGSHILTVTYPGDATHAPTRANYAMLIGTGTASGSMTLSAGNLTLNNNSTGSTQVSITPGGGYNGRVFWSLSITGSNATGASNLTGCYSIAPTLVNGTTTAKLTLGLGTACNSPLPSAAHTLRGTRPAANPGWRSFSFTGISLGLLLSASFARRRRKLGLYLALILLPLAGANLIACGGGSGSKSTTPSQPAVTYTMQLTGTDSVNTSVVASTTFTLTVN
jgi:subtilase family serine protease